MIGNTPVIYPGDIDPPTVVAVGSAFGKACSSIGTVLLHRGALDDGVDSKVSAPGAHSAFTAPDLVEEITPWPPQDFPDLLLVDFGEYLGGGRFRSTHEMPSFVDRVVLFTPIADPWLAVDTHTPLQAQAIKEVTDEISGATGLPCTALGTYLLMPQESRRALAETDWIVIQSLEPQAMLPRYVREEREFLRSYADTDARPFLRIPAW